MLQSTGYFCHNFRKILDLRQKVEYNLFINNKQKEIAMKFTKEYMREAVEKYFMDIFGEDASFLEDFQIAESFMNLWYQGKIIV